MENLWAQDMTQESLGKVDFQNHLGCLGVSLSCHRGSFYKVAPFLSHIFWSSKFLLTVHKYPQVPPILKQNKTQTLPPALHSHPPCNVILLLLLLSLPQSLPPQQNFLKALSALPPTSHFSFLSTSQLSSCLLLHNCAPPSPCPHGWLRGFSWSRVSDLASQFTSRTHFLPHFRPGTAP